MKAKEIMTPNPISCTPADTVQDVARMMRDADCGSVPIVERDSKLIGVITDRDLAIRGLAEGKGPDTKVNELMTESPFYCSADDDVRDVGRAMADHQVRRVPIVDADGRLTGIIAQADLARAASDNEGVTDEEVGIVVERISEPARPQL